MERIRVLGGVLACLVLVGLGACGEDNENTQQPMTGDLREMPGMNADGNGQPTDGNMPMPSPQAAMGDGTRYTQIVVDNDAHGPAFAEVADMNGDGRLDLLITQFGRLQGMAISPGRVTIYYQGESLTDWSQREDIFGPTEGIFWPNDLEIHDIDGDGDLDVAVGTGFLICGFLGRINADGSESPAAPCGGLIWFEKSPNGWIRHDIVAPTSDLFYHKPAIVDFDGDGIEDMVVVGESRPPEGASGDRAMAQWFKGNTTPKRFETTPRDMAPYLGSLPTVLDMDGDGDLDVASAEFFTGKGGSFAWLERVSEPSEAEPAGGWVRHVIDDKVGPSIQLSFIPNLFGDGRTIAVGSNHTNTTGDPAEPWESAVYVYEPQSIVTLPWSKRKITTNIASIPRDNQAAPGIFGWGDTDADGDIDILLSGDGDKRVFVLEQQPDKTFKTKVLVDNLTQAGGMRVKDLNGDGRPELVVSGFDDNAIFLYSLDPQGEIALKDAGIPEWALGAQPKTNLEIRYSGDKSGPLAIAFFDNYPPMGPPRKFESVESPTFPVSVETDFAEPGSYKLLAFIDSDNSGLMAVTEGDPELVLDVTLPVSDAIVIDLDGNGGQQGGNGTTTPDTPAPNTNPDQRTTVNVTVNYAGAPNGKTLAVAAFTTLPPQGSPRMAPIGVPQIIPGVSGFPVQVTIDMVPGSTCQILAYLDTDDSGAMFPSEMDPIGRTEVITLNGTAVDATVELVNP